MNRADLIEEWERRRAHAARIGSTAPVAEVYGVALEEIRQADGTPDPGQFVGTGKAAEVLDVSPKTVRRYCQDDKFPGARKTTEHGEWRIPLRDVHRAAGEARPPTETPRLWEPDA